MTDDLKCCLPNHPLAPPHICRNSHLKFNVNPTFPSFSPPIKKLPMASAFAARAHGFRGRRMASRARVSGLVVVRCAVSDVGEEKGDGFYMRRCVELARKVVGEGFHPKAGQPHAKVFALRDAGDLAENVTAYMSLEPCNHYGGTQPCTMHLSLWMCSSTNY